MKKIIYLALILVLPMIMTGCFVTDKLTEKAGEEITEKVLESATNSNIELDQGNQQITIEGEQGETYQMGENLELPSDFPSDVPVYSDAKIVSASSSATEASYNLTQTSTDNHTNIANYYKEGLEKNGWTIDYDSNFASEGTQTSSYTATKDNRELYVSIYDFGEGENTIALSVGKKME